MKRREIVWLCLTIMAACAIVFVLWAAIRVWQGKEINPLHNLRYFYSSLLGEANSSYAV